MRRRSLTGPLLLLAIGGLFLWRNLHPESDVFSLLWTYWPFILIAWGVMRLIEVFVWNRQGYQTGFTGGEIVLVVLICIAGVGVSQARRFGFQVDSGNFDIMGTQSYDYAITSSAPAAGVKRIVFDNPRGNIKVTGSDTQEIRVTGQKSIRTLHRSDADRTNERTPVELVHEGDRMVIRTNQSRASSARRISADLEVSVPRGVEVESRSAFGDCEIADIMGSVQIEADHGDVRLTRLGGNARLEAWRSELVSAIGVKGRFDLYGEGSDIELEDIGGPVSIGGLYRGTLDLRNLAKPLQIDGVRNSQVHVEATPGHIKMDLSQFAAENLVGPIRLVTNSRDVKLEKFTGALDLETTRGDIELAPGGLPLPSIDARSSAGQITLDLPPASTFNLQAVADTGEAVNEFGSQIRREVEGRTAKLSGRVGDGPAIRLNTNRGTITVRKEGASGSAPDKGIKVPKGTVL